MGDSQRLGGRGVEGGGLLGEVTVQGSYEGEDHQLMEAGGVKNIGSEQGLITRSSDEERSVWSPGRCS